MEQLFTPHVGLMVWTALTFLLLVFILGRFGWKPLIKGLEAREEKIKSDLSAADQARAGAERSRQEFEAKMADAHVKTQALLSQAERDSRKFREDLMKAAQDEAARLAEKTRRELAEEQRRLVQNLRGEVAALSVATAEKLLRKSVDKSVQDKVLQEAVSDLDSWAKSKN